MNQQSMLFIYFLYSVCLTRINHIRLFFNIFNNTDATINVKSPPKEVKTSKNLQMRHKFQEPVQSLHRSDALSPTWRFGRKSYI